MVQAEIDEGSVPEFVHRLTKRVNPSAAGDCVLRMERDLLSRAAALPLIQVN